MKSGSSSYDTLQPPAPGATASSAYVGVPSDRSSSLGRDASGDVTYDGLNSYLYDAEGARIAKTTIPAAPATATSLCAPPLGAGYTLSARYLVDQGGDQVTEINGAGVWQHSNVFSAARLTATYDKLGLHYELADPLGTKRVQANTKGFVEEWYASLPYGDALTPIPNTACTSANNCFAEDATEHHFTGKERDAESGNDYFGARYYASSMGRWLSPDWSAKAEPVPYAKLDNPQSLNLYTYVGNNPLIHIDADGHCWLQNLCNAVINAWNNAKQALNQAGSYFYATGFKGTGDQITVGIKGVVKFEAGHKEGTEVTRHLNGEKEEKEIKSSVHAKVEIAGYSLGAERKVEGGDSKPKWEFSAGREGVEGKGGQVGVSAEFCHGTCSSIEGGVEAGKAFNDLLKNTPPPQPGSLDELMTIAPK